MGGNLLIISLSVCIHMCIHAYYVYVQKYGEVCICFCIHIPEVSIAYRPLLHFTFFWRQSISLICLDSLSRKSQGFSHPYLPSTEVRGVAWPCHRGSAVVHSSPHPCIEWQAIYQLRHLLSPLEISFFQEWYIYITFTHIPGKKYSCVLTKIHRNFILAVSLGRNKYGKGGIMAQYSPPSTVRWNQGMIHKLWLPVAFLMYLWGCMCF